MNIYLRYTRIAAIEDRTKSIEIIIHDIKSTFSKPLFVVCMVPESLSPSAPPSPEPDFCRRMTAMSITERSIWTHGKICMLFSMRVSMP